MSGDTLKRVQAVKKWLERAESSYSSHKEITGEINLIMAQAEMQRLKETRKPSAFYKWGLRGCAMIVAAVLFFGVTSLYQKAQQPEESHPAAVEIAVSEPTLNASPAVSITKETEPESLPVEATPVETSPTVEAVSAAPVSQPAAAVQEKPVAVAPVSTPRPAPAPPALSEKEIQSVVGEAGRALRGQV